MKKWIKLSGLVAALAAVSVISFSAVSFAQAETPTSPPSVVERLRSGLQDRFGGPGGPRGHRGGEMDAERQAEQEAALAEALGMSVDELQAARDAGQTIEEIAAAQGIDLDTLKTTLDAARLEAMKAQLAEKVAAGDITQEQADAMLLRLETGDLFGHGGRGDFGLGEFGGRPGKTHDLSQLPVEAQAALAEALNMSVEELQAAVESGQTLPEIVEAQGVEMETLKSALDEFRLAELEANLAEKVTAGDLTQEQADAILAQAQSGDFPGRGGMKGFPCGPGDGGRGGMRGHPGGHGGMRGFPGDATPDSAAPDGTNFQTTPSTDSNL